MQLPTRRMTAGQLWLDAALILLLAAATLLWNDLTPVLSGPTDRLIRAYGSADAWRTHMVWWWLASLPAAAGIVLRHRWPTAATLVAAGSTGLHLLDPVIKSSPMDVAVLVTMYTLAGSARSRRTAIRVLVALDASLYAGYLIVRMGETGADPTGRKSPATVGDPLANLVHGIAHADALTSLVNAAKEATVPALLLAATWAVADGARTRRAHLATLQGRADDIEREQQQRTALAVAAERGRISRELHDVVAHGLSVIVVQALGGRTMLSRQPDRTENALTNIITTGRASLAEMRRLLGLVRTEQGAELAPQPSLATLPELVDRVRDSGTPVDFRVTGEPATLPAVVELAAYRIVQEALTNTLKHATPGAGCTVTLHFGPAGLGIRVADRGRPVAPPSPGNGLRGITERVHALGGELRAGPSAGGGFELSALLPATTAEPLPAADAAPAADAVPAADPVPERIP